MSFNNNPYKEDLELITDLLDEDLNITDPKVDDDGGFSISINGNTYKYKSDSLTSQDLLRKFNGIAKHSKGRALQWLKRNSKYYSKNGTPIAESDELYSRNTDIDMAYRYFDSLIEDAHIAVEAIDDWYKSGDDSTDLETLQKQLRSSFVSCKADISEITEFIK
jgi:hypothetical protein